MQTVRIFTIITTTLWNKTQTQQYINIFFYFMNVSLVALSLYKKTKVSNFSAVYQNRKKKLKDSIRIQLCVKYNIMATLFIRFMRIWRSMS